ncbi:MAG: urease accessory protein UreF [Oscillatoriophycideae cyanobacterium NC_groundwater_1537_Pr4_S-0.65um_50_18]|nr:urease accessory protein UreF [Oscillatoriophycideae cyanobacterium NC_groundwater_1537_Pr4_S-0.65um_50_18]
MIQTQALLQLLQLTSPALPVGAYSYSEGLETLVQSDAVSDLPSLEHWLTQELRYGTIRLEAIALLKAHEAATVDHETLSYWNDWLSALRETEEMREQSWQMGRSLTRLLLQLQSELQPIILACGEPCNFAIAFAIAAQHWQIDPRTAVLGYLHSWVANLVNAGVRLIPLGQTQGQHLLLNLYPQVEKTVDAILQQTEDELWNCNWGFAIASMNHEILYSRLFRS